MEACTLFGTRVTIGVTPPPAPDNENLTLLPEGMTPAELMQWVRREQEQLRREAVADERLLADPTHRQERDAWRAIGECCRWHHYRRS